MPYGIRYNIGSSHGMWPVRYQAITRTNAVLLSIVPLGQTSVKSISIQEFDISKSQPISSGLNVLIQHKELSQTNLEWFLFITCVQVWWEYWRWSHCGRAGMASSLGHPDWLLFVNYRCWAAEPHRYVFNKTSLIAKFMGPTWDPPGDDRPQVGPMLAPWTLLSGLRVRITLVLWFVSSIFSESTLGKIIGTLSRGNVMLYVANVFFCMMM